MIENIGPNKFTPVRVDCTTLSEAWVRLIWNCLEYGRPYLIEEGSRAGQHRMTMDFAEAVIRYPETRPFTPLAKPGQVVTVDEEKIEDYCKRYVYSPLPPEPDEHYNYSEYLYPLSKLIVDYYSTKGFNNAHPVMRVGDPFCFRDYFKPHENESQRKTTPCLLLINPKIISYDNSYNMIFHIVYRSWDLTNGYLCNNGGFQILKETMCAEISCNTNKDIKPGPTITTCVDLHIYEEDLTAAAGWSGHDVTNLVEILKKNRGIG